MTPEATRLGEGRASPFLGRRHGGEPVAPSQRQAPPDLALRLQDDNPGNGEAPLIADATGWKQRSVDRDRPERRVCEPTHIQERERVLDSSSRKIAGIESGERCNEEVLARFRIGPRRARRCRYHFRHQQYAPLAFTLACAFAVLGGVVVVATFSRTPAVASCDGCRPSNGAKTTLLCQAAARFCRSLYDHVRRSSRVR